MLRVWKWASWHWSLQWSHLSVKFPLFPLFLQTGSFTSALQYVQADSSAKKSSLWRMSYLHPGTTLFLSLPLYPSFLKEVFSLAVSTSICSPNSLSISHFTTLSSLSVTLLLPDRVVSYLTDFSAAFCTVGILRCCSSCSFLVSLVGSSSSAHSSKAGFPSVFSLDSLLFSMHTICLREVIHSNDSNNNLYPADPAQMSLMNSTSLFTLDWIYTRGCSTNSFNSNCLNLK